MSPLVEIPLLIPSPTMNFRKSLPRVILVASLLPFLGKLSAEAATASLDLADAAITERYLERRGIVMEDSIATINPDLTVPTGAFVDIALALQQGKNVEKALMRLV